ncbi:MAG TPA: hypothetical protein VFW17_17045 [Ktedonobacterales bacterium]|nr:hypothetical protein [Ktedonobacterales bacterium]
MQNQPDPYGAPAPAAPQAAAQQAAPAVAEKPVNTYGLRSLFAAVGSLLVTAITAFAFQRVIIYFALLGVYGVYAGLRGIFTAFRVPKLQGLITSIIGLILSIAAIIFTVWLFTPE